MNSEEYDGGCTCSEIRYRMNNAPMFVHCCHCRWCQRESGAAFALNGLIEATEVVVTKGQIELIDTPSISGHGQRISRCGNCRIALWSTYSPPGEAIYFLRIGTLDNPARFPPNIHIFTSSKQPWINLEGGAPSMLEYYERSEYWSVENIARYDNAIGN